MVALVLLIAYNWRLLSDALGFAMAKGRRQQKKNRKNLPVIVWIAAWLIAIYALYQRCGGKGVFCASPNPSAGTPIESFVGASNPGPTIPGIALITAVGQIVQTSWFTITFIGLLAIGSVIIVRGFIVSWNETQRTISLAPTIEAEGQAAVEEAIQILESPDEPDPRTRIIRSYERMIQAAQRLGASITRDQTARELQSAIQKMMLLKGPSIVELTMLFEEARYSLHKITDGEAEEAHACLLDIARQMKVPISV